MTNQIMRRDFIKKTLGIGAGLTVSAFAVAQMGRGGMMRGGMMGNGGMGGMSCHSSLLPATQLPAGQALNGLWLLPNRSRKAGEFRAKLIAKPSGIELIKGVTTQFWSYNDKIPGPLIDVYEGDTVEIEFENQLPQPTTIHWHGVPVPATQDGAPLALVEPGKTITYKYTLPEGSAGTYWFHPHPHMMTAEQVFRGLAGAFIVRAKNDPLKNLPERHLIFSDLKLGSDGQIPLNDMMDWMNGREGQFALLNGQRQPSIDVKEPQRWRLWNMNSARYLRLSLAGTPITLVGTDGGLLEKPEKVQELLLSPGERAEIIVDPAILARAGSQIMLTTEEYDRGKMMHAIITPRMVLAQINVLNNAKAVYPLPERLRTIKPLGQAVNARRIELQEVMDMHAMHNGVDQHGKPMGMDFLLNGKKFDPLRIDEHMKRNEVEVWEFYNNTDMDHPMHMHGSHFQVIDRQLGKGARVAEPFIAWKDTVNVRPQEVVRVKVSQERAGDWMYHCHILEHEDLGMMGIVRVS